MLDMFSPYMLLQVIGVIQSSTKLWNVVCTTNSARKGIKDPPFFRSFGEMGMGHVGKGVVKICDPESTA